MRWLGLYTPAAAWLLFLAIPLVVFYFLKLRRPRTLVSSLVLWQRVLADRRVNSPFQRFKRNLLLLLQLLLLLLLVLAAMQPYVRHSRSQVSRLPILLDCSASMGALDRAGGETRLEAAKKRVRALIENLGPNQELCLIAFADTARRLTGFTDNRRLLLEALEKVRVLDVPADVAEVVRVVDALSRQEAFTRVVLISDGNVPARVHEDLSFDLDYRLVPKAGSNIGITALSARRESAHGWELFLRIGSSDPQPRTAVLTLERNGAEVVSEPVTVSADAPERLVVRLDGSEACEVTARLRAEGFDSLACDNTAYLSLAPIRDLVVCVPDSLPAFRHALRQLDGVEVRDTLVPGADMVVRRSGGDTPEGEASVVVTVGGIPPDLATYLAPGTGGSEIVDWVRDCDLLRYVELSGVDVFERVVYAAGASAGDLDKRGYVILAESGQGPLMLRKKERGRCLYYLLFDVARSNLPYRIAFPVMVRNLVSVALRGMGQQRTEAFATGVLAGVKLGGGERSGTVIDPAGERLPVVGDEDGRFSGIEARRCGMYRFVADSGATYGFGVSLLNGFESGLGRVRELAFREELSVAAMDGDVPTEKPLRSMLSVVALLLLLGEWWWYQRRAG